MSAKTVYTPRNPCPICGGHRDLPQHRGIRCHGYTDSTGDYARCTREELAGAIKQNDDGTFSHLLHGSCNCGKQHGPKSASAWGHKSQTRRHAAVTHTSSWRAYSPDGSFAIHRRYDRSDGSKSFAWLHADLQPSQNGEIHSTDKLYGLACLDRKRPGALVEGEKAADALRAMVGDTYAVLATVCGAPTVPDAAVLAYVAGKVGPDGLVIWPDNDLAGAKQMDSAGAILRAHGVNVRRVTWPDAPDHGDAADYCATHNKAELLALLEAAPKWQGVTASDGLPTAGLLDEIEGFVRRYVVLPRKDDYLIVALWILHAWAIDAFDVTPRLIASSPEPESGKTRLLEVVKVLIPQAVFSLNISVAAIYSFVRTGNRPLLFDEVDAVFSQKANDEGSEALRGILNGGYSRAATVIRVKMPGRIVEEFPVFAPAALATIGRLPNTIESRAITLRMQRRTDDETVDTFRERAARVAAEPILELVKLWAPANTKALREARPEMPESISDRAADILEPLFAIADLAGAEYAERARMAAVELMQDRLADEQSIGIQLLRAIHDGWNSIADPAKPDQVTTADLLAHLNHLDEYPFGSWNKGNGFHSRNLGAYLKQYALRSRGVRVADSTPKGYIRHDFEDAWSRYLKPIRHAATHPQRIRHTDSNSDSADVADVSVCRGEDAEGAEDRAGNVDEASSLSSQISATAATNGPIRVRIVTEGGDYKLVDLAGQPMNAGLFVGPLQAESYAKRQGWEVDA